MVSTRTAVGLSGKLLLVVAAVLLIGLTSMVVASADTGTELAAFLPLGDLQSPAASESQTGVLDTLIAGLRVAESSQSQGDITFIVTKRSSVGAYNSLSAVSKVENGKLPPQDCVTGPVTYKTRWAWDPTRSRYDSAVVTSPTGVQCLSNTSRVYDGHNSADYYPDEKRAAIQPSKTSRPVLAEEPRLVLSTYGDGPFSGVLARPGVTYSGRQTVGGTACHRVTVNRNSDRIDLWFSDAQGCRAKRMEFSSATMYSLTEVTQFSPSGLPMAGRCSRFSVNGTDKEWLSTTEWSVQQWSPTVASGVLGLQFPTGTKVTDLSGREPATYTVGG